MVDTVPSSTAMSSQQKPLTMIVAATRNMGIGLNGSLPWRLKNEMAYFARVTKRVPAGIPETARNAVLMGRKTWESIPAKFRPLKDRVNIVVSRTATSLPGAILARSVENALQLAEKADTARIFVIGGAEIYKAAMAHPQAANVLLTRVDTDFDCDTFFPVDVSMGEDGWRKRSYEELCAFIGEDAPRGSQKEETAEYEFELYQKE